MDRNDKVSSFLVECGFSAPFNPKSLMQIYKYWDQLVPNYYFFANYVLISFVSWQISFEQNHKVDCISFFLSCFLKLTTQVPNMNHLRIKRLATGAFYRVFQSYLSVIPLSSPELFFPMLSKFFAINHDMPKGFYDIIVQSSEALSASYDVDRNFDISSFISVIAIICEQIGPKLDNNIADGMIIALANRVSELNLAALNLYEHLAPQIPEFLTKTLFRIFPTSIANFLKQTSPRNVITRDNEEDIPIYPYLMNSQVILQFVDQPTFRNGINLEPNVPFPQRYDFAALVSPDMRSILNIISVCAKGKPSMIPLLMNSLEGVIADPNNNEYQLDLLACYLFLATFLFSKMNFHKTLSVLMARPIFNPNDTVFTPSSDFRLINTFRAEVIDLLLSDRCAHFNLLMIKWIQFPNLFAEICYRIVKSCNWVQPNPDITPMYTKTLMSVSLHFQQLNYQFVNDQSIETARNSILYMISQLLLSAKSMRLLFRDSYFITFFLSLIFELPIHNYVLSNLLTFLSRANKITDGLVSTLLQIIHICISSFPEERAMTVGNEILHTLVEALALHQTLAIYIEPLCQPIFDSLVKLTCSELSKSYLILCLQFFSLIAITQRLGHAQISALQIAISNVFEHELPPQLFSKLVQLIAGAKLPSLNPTFEIQQPKMLKLFLSIYFPDTKCIEVINFIDDLCKYSTSNCISCHSTEFDLFLIEKLVLLKNVEDERVEAILALFQRIATVRSSPAVVQRFISLLSPIGNHYLPIHQRKYIKTINTIVSASARYPLASIPLTEDTIEFYDISSSDFESGFSFIAWLYLDADQAQYQPYILRISDQKDSSMEIFLSGTTLFAVQRTNGFEMVGKVANSLPTKVWFSLDISMIFKSNESNMKLNCNCREIMEFDFQKMEFKPNNVFIKVGGLTKDSIKTEFCAKIGPCGVFPLLPKDYVTAVCEMGPRVKGPMTRMPCFFFIPNETNGIIKLVWKKIKFGVQTKMPVIKSTTNLTFIESLVHFCKIEMLLPLFSQMDMTYSSGEYEAFFSKSLIELFSNTLLLSMDAQESFLQSHGVSIIAFWLINCSEKHINYQLYHMFYQLMCSLTNKELQIEFVNHILINLEIFIRTDADNHIRIIRHWARILFPTNPTFANFQFILLVMRTYYWYSSLEEPLLRGQNRDQNLNVYECRKQLNVIALIIASKQELTEQDIQVFQSHIITCYEDQQVIDLLVLYKSISTSSSEDLSKLSKEIDLISFLYSMFSRQNKLIYKLIAEIPLVFHHRGLTNFTKFSVSEHVNFVLENISTKYITEEFLNQSTESLSECPELLPICCWMAMKLGKDIVIKFFKQLVPCDDYCMNPNWAMVPVALTYQFDQEAYSQILSFLSLCNPKEWINIFSLIVVIGASMNIDPSTRLNLYFSSIANFILLKSEAAGQYYLDFLQMSQFYILFRNSSLENAGLLEFMSNSCFETSFSKNHNECPVLFNPRALFTLIRETKGKFEYNFGLRFDEKLNWLDLDLAVDTLELILKYKPPKFVQFALVLLSYVSEIKPDYVHAYHVAFNHSKESISDNNILFCLVRHHLKSDLPDLEIDEVEENSFQCATKIPQTLRQNMSPFFLETLEKLKEFVTYEIDMRESDQILVLSSNERQNCLSNIEEELKIDSEAWNRLWMCLAVDLAPWSSSFPDSIHFKRDRTICMNNCPIKLKRDWSFQQHVKQNVETEQKPVFESACYQVLPNYKKTGTLYLFKEEIYIMFPDMVKRIKLNSIEFVYLRVYKHKRNAFEIFNKKKKSYFFVLIDCESSIPFLTKLKDFECKVQLSDFIAFFKENKDITEKWINREITNFEYLITLSRLSGKSYNTVKNYPVFPKVLLAHDNSSLDLRDPDVFKDLKTPIKEEEFTFKPYGKKFIVTSEYIPEFFCMSECVLENVELPRWAKNASEFVYNNRKALESDIVSRDLSFWIDCMYLGSLTSLPHPMRSTRSSPSMYFNTAYAIQPKNTEVLAFSYVKDTKITLAYKSGLLLTNIINCSQMETIIFNPNTLSSLQIDDVSSLIKFEQAVTQKEIKGLKLEEASASLINNDIFAAISSNSIYKINLSSKSYEIMNDDAVYMATDGDYMAVAGHDAVVKVYLRDEVILSMPTYRDLISCLAIDADYMVVVIGTNDGSLIINTLSHGSTMRVIDLNGARPLNVCVTKGMGFIVAYSVIYKDGKLANWVNIYNINGDRIRAVKLNFNISLWTTVRNADGLDYMIISTDRGKLYSFEVFYFETTDSFYRCQTTLSSISYSKSMSCVVCVTKGGSVLLIPHIFCY